MSGISLKNLLELPESVACELQNRNREKREIIANNLVNKLTGQNLPVDNAMFNRYSTGNTSNKFSQKLDSNVLIHRKK